jgi:hypothetical protein
MVSRRAFSPWHVIRRASGAPSTTNACGAALIPLAATFNGVSFRSAAEMDRRTDRIAMVESDPIPTFAQARTTKPAQ